MAFVKRIRIDVMTESGALLLSEIHDISYGPLGLLRVPKRLGLVMDEMVCFPSKEEAMDSSNGGVPYDAVCNTFQPGCGLAYTDSLVSAGFQILDDFVCHLWVRAVSTIKAPFTSDTGLECANETSTQCSRRHLSKVVRGRMKELCNIICPRNEDGVMLAERGASDMNRPVWCIEEIMATLREEFDASELDGAKEKAQNYMARAALQLRRIKSITQEEWLAMTSEVRKKMKT